MTDERLYSSGNVRLRVYPSTGFANFHWPTVAELNAGLRLEDASPWDSFDVGVQASDTSDTPPISAKASVATRAQANYGGGLPVWYPGYYDDASNQLSLIYDLLDEPRTDIFVVMAVDGQIGESGQPTSSMVFADGDYCTVMKLTTDAWNDDNTVGDDPFFYVPNLLKKGGLAHYTVASTTAPTLVAAGSATATVGDIEPYSATANSRVYTTGVTWSTSDSTKATVSQAGIVTFLASGSVDIVATLPKTSVATSDTVSVTVT